MISAHAPALVDYVYIVDIFPHSGGHARILLNSKFPGGAGANVVHNLATLGVETMLFTTLGKDEDARFFVENTKAKIFSEITDELTGKVLVFVDKRGERTFFVQPNSAGKPFVKVKFGDFLYIDPFPSEMSFEIQKEVMKNFDGFVTLNPGYIYVSMGLERLVELLEFTDMLIMSSSEFEMLKCSPVDLIKYVDYLIITLGENGAICYTKKEKISEKAYKAKVVDTTGAGDAFAAGFLYGFINGLPMKLCLRLGNYCGAYNVERIGARAFPSKNVVEEFLEILKDSR
ncbi:MAG: PfkB family carbohydrate kinase [Archaeoglobaceae archaeon]|nr:PfkB family carbohydrate kinase [Archaeoglobaceae archaeon]MDW7989139.1 PfkB family carbohydrate kinase [Archaeoglobaceae archaeon]